MWLSGEFQVNFKTDEKIDIKFSSQGWSRVDKRAEDQTRSNCTERTNTVKILKIHKGKEKDKTTAPWWKTMKGSVSFVCVVVN